MWGVRLRETSIEDYQIWLITYRIRFCTTASTCPDGRKDSADTGDKHEESIHQRASGIGVLCNKTVFA